MQAKCDLILVLENCNRGDIHGASTEWFTVPKLPKESFQLHFMTSMPSHLFTEAKVQGDQGTTVRVALLNPETGHVVHSGPGSTAMLNLFILNRDVEKVEITGEQLESHTISEGSEERKPILSGDLLVTRGGIGTLGHFTFTQDSSRTKSGKYRLGVEVACRCYAAMHIHGALSEAFAVEDSRGECDSSKQLLFV